MKRGVFPVLGDPVGVLDNAQAAQQGNPLELLLREMAKLLIAFQKLIQFFVIVFIASKKHPEILNLGTHTEIVKINEEEFFAVMEQIAAMTVTVNAQKTVGLENIFKTFQN